MPYSKKNDYTRIIKITYWIIAACIAALALLIYELGINDYLGGNLEYLIFALPILISAFMFLMILYNLKKAVTDQINELRKGILLAEWSYSEEEWHKFNFKEWKRSSRKSVLIPLAMMVVLLIFDRMESNPAGEGIAPAIPYLLVFFITLSFGLLYYSYQLYNRTKDCPREIKIGEHGFLYGGYYTSWDVTGTKLGGVKIINNRASMMEFEIKSRGRYGYNSKFVRIPIPQGKVIAAEEVKNLILQKNHLAG